MKSGLTIREDNYSVVLDALKQLSGTDVLVGIPAGPPRDDAPLSNAELGYLQSTGATVEIDGETVTLPPRPFLDMGIEDSRDKTTERLKLAAQSALEGKADDMVITSHICRGNYHSTFFSSGGYAPVADYVFAQENVDALFLEYDDERSGDFAPLAKVSSDKQVVLGLITTKSPKLESKEAVIARINEAAKYIPIERLCLSPQCGFASCEIGNKLTEDEQWAKLELVKEIAEEVWK